MTLSSIEYHVVMHVMTTTSQCQLGLQECTFSKRLFGEYNINYYIKYKIDLLKTYVVRKHTIKQSLQFIKC